MTLDEMIAGFTHSDDGWGACKKWVTNGHVLLARAGLGPVDLPPLDTKSRNPTPLVLAALSSLNPCNEITDLRIKGRLRKGRSLYRPGQAVYLCADGTSVVISEVYSRLLEGLDTFIGQTHVGPVLVGGEAKVVIMRMADALEDARRRIKERETHRLSIRSRAKEMRS